MDTSEYEMLVKSREELKSLLDHPLINRHRTTIESQLSDIRKKLKDAHRSKYKSTSK
jgi:hypothetical protein